MDYNAQLEHAHKQIKKLRKLQKNLRKTDDKLLAIGKRITDNKIDKEVHEKVLEELQQLRLQVDEMQQAEKLVNDVHEILVGLKADSDGYLEKADEQRKRFDEMSGELNVVKDMERYVEEAQFRMADEKQNLLLELNKAEELSQNVDKMSIHIQELEHREKEAARREGK